jgi:hypothetical protein
VHEILETGIEFIVWLQQYQTATSDTIFEFVTRLGGRNYLYMIPLVIWCVDYRTGLRLLTVFSLTVFINTTLKVWIGQPRPFQLDERVISAGEQGYGLPSGHAQLTVIFWGVIAAWAARPWFWALGVALMAAIGFSRIYLGVHFPSDVIAGWALGAVTLWAFIAYGERVESALRRHDLAAQIGVALAVGVLLFLFDALFVGDADHLNVGAAGFIAGAGVGTAVGARHLHFDGRGPWWQRLLRYLVGMAVMLPLLGVMRKFGVPDGVAGNAVIALDLAILGLWLTLAAPWLFQLIRLSPPTASRPLVQETA